MEASGAIGTAKIDRLGAMATAKIDL